MLERGEVANSWRHERWDSLRLLTPNWQSRLPGVRYDGPDPDGYMTSAEVAELIARFAEHARAPVRTGTNVTSLRRTDDGYRVTTSQGEIQSRTVVIASGACNRPTVPALADALPAERRAADAVRRTATRPSSRTAACSSSARRPPACSWRPSCGNRDGR